MMLAAQRSLFTEAFNPLSLSPALWLSDTGSNAGQWDDLSGNGRHATQATSGNQPSIVANALNGRQVRRFDGVDDFMSMDKFLNGNATAIYVFRLNNDPPSAARSGPVLGDWGTAFDANHFPWEDGVIYDGFGATERKVVGNPTPTLTQFRIISQISATNNWQFWIDSASLFATLTNTTDWQYSPKIARSSSGSASFFLDGDIAEILVFSTALSTENRRRVEQYLSQKYAIAIL
jgi:hypothetical protein